MTLSFLDAKEYRSIGPQQPPRSRTSGRQPPRYTPRHVAGDWLLRRDKQRAEARRIEEASAWLFERHAQRRLLRDSSTSSNIDWLQKRAKHRASLRQPLKP